MKKIFLIFVLIHSVCTMRFALAANSERVAPVEKKSTIYDYSGPGLKLLDAAVAMTRQQAFICDSVSGFSPWSNKMDTFFHAINIDTSTKLRL